MTLESILNLEKHARAVGEEYRWIYKGRSYAIVYTKAGMYRGSHTHPNIQRTLLLDGKGRYVFKVNGEEVTHHLKHGVALEVPAEVPHILLADEDSLTIEWWEGMIESKEFDFPHYTREIKKRIEAINKSLNEPK